MKARRVVRGYPLQFEWDGYDGGNGGEYIDIAFVSGEAFDVINTTTADGELIPFTRENFRKEITKWCKDVDAYELGEHSLAVRGR